MSTFKSKNSLNCLVFTLQTGKLRRHSLPGLQGEHSTRHRNRRLLELRTPATTGHPKNHTHDVSAFFLPHAFVTTKKQL